MSGLVSVFVYGAILDARVCDIVLQRPVRAVPARLGGFVVRSVNGRHFPGLVALGLERTGGFYPSPGCLSEYEFAYVGLVDLAGVEGGTFGVQAEGEDILTHVLDWARTVSLITSGEADTSALLVSLL